MSNTSPVARARASASHLIAAMMASVFLVSGCWVGNTDALLDAPMGLGVMTYNIKQANPDLEPWQQWNNRKWEVFAFLDAMDVDVLLMQEVMPQQLDDLDAALPQYAWYGRGRDADGSGEAVPIFYRNDRFARVSGGHFWLSTTPTVPGTGFNGDTRMCTWVRLEERATGRRFFVFNTHFQAYSTAEDMEHRRKSAILVMDRIDERLSNDPVLLGGDFNTREWSPVRAYVESGGKPWSYANDVATPLFDSYRALNILDGNQGTTNGWDATDIDGSPIDFIFASEGAVAESSDILYPLRGDGRVLSDHWPVLSQLTLPHPDEASTDAIASAYLAGRESGFRSVLGQFGVALTEGVDVWRYTVTDSTKLGIPGIINGDELVSVNGWEAEGGVSHEHSLGRDFARLGVTLRELTLTVVVRRGGSLVTLTYPTAFLPSAVLSAVLAVL